MKLKRLVASDFLSFGTIQIDFDKFNGLTVVEGVNKDSNPICSNGSGKSSLWEAVTFALFGRTIRKTRESSIIRHGAKSCTVDLEVDVDGNRVFIQRGRRPSKLFISINGKDATRENAVETQKYLTEYLNLDFTTYLAAVMFGQNNQSDFINSTPSDKRKILQSFLGIQDYFEIREVVKNRKKDVKNEIRELEGEKKAHRKHINDLEEQIKKSKEAENLEEIENAEQKLQRWQVYYNQKNLLEADKKKRDKVNREIAILTTKLDTVEETNKCFTCGQKLKSKKVVKDIEKELKDLLDDLDALEIKCKYGPEIPDAESKEEIEEYLNKKKYQTNTTDLQEIIDKSQVELEEVDETLNKLTRQVVLYEYWERAFSEQGLVKYIIRNIIDFFNSQVNYYLSLITNGHLTINFSQSLEETIFSGKSCVEYNAMSGGERKKINISVMLGLHDLLRFNKKSTPDFAIFDEITEIDKSGIRNISSLMETIAKTHKKKIFMITHNSDLMSELGSYNKIVVEKKKSKSKIKEIKYA